MCFPLFFWEFQVSVERVRIMLISWTDETDPILNFGKTSDSDLSGMIYMQLAWTVVISGTVL